MRKSKSELDLVRNSIGVASALDRRPQGRRRSASSSTSDAESVHGWWVYVNRKLLTACRPDKKLLKLLFAKL